MPSSITLVVGLLVLSVAPRRQRSARHAEDHPRSRDGLQRPRRPPAAAQDHLGRLRRLHHRRREQGQRGPHDRGARPPTAWTQASRRIKENWSKYMATTLTTDEQRLAAEAEQLFGPADVAVGRLQSRLTSSGGDLTGTLGDVDGPLYDVIDPVTTKITELVDLQLQRGPRRVRRGHRPLSPGVRAEPRHAGRGVAARHGRGHDHGAPPQRRARVGGDHAARRRRPDRQRRRPGLHRQSDPGRRAPAIRRPPSSRPARRWRRSRAGPASTPRTPRKRRASPPARATPPRKARRTSAT